jgi:hypothetical protein
MARKVSNSVDANGDKNSRVSVESTWTGGVQVVDTRLDRRQLRWMESTVGSATARSHREPSTQGLLGGLPKDVGGPLMMKTS